MQNTADNGIWVGTWGTALYYGDETGDEGRASALRVSKTLAGATLRQIIRVSVRAERLRLTFSNEYGQTNLMIRDVHIAKATVPAASDIDVLTDTAVTFGGGRSVTIAPGGRVVSDAVNFKTDALERVAVSVYIEAVPECLACHVGARANSFVKTGNCVSDVVLDNAQVNTHWFSLCNADVHWVCQENRPPDTHSVIVLGDSITDGYGVTDERYTRWTDVLIEHLQANPGTQHICVINMGIGTNKLYGQTNPSAAIERFGRDVLNQPGCGVFVFFIGVNDLSEPQTKAEDIISGYRQMINKAKDRGLKTIGCTITPYAKNDPRRHVINNWLRGQSESGILDGLFDFDNLLKNPGSPDYMLPEYDNDGIHPCEAAYRAMGEYAYGQLRVKN